MFIVRTKAEIYTTGRPGAKAHNTTFLPKIVECLDVGLATWHVQDGQIAEAHKNK